MIAYIYLQVVKLFIPNIIQFILNNKINVVISPILCNFVGIGSGRGTLEHCVQLASRAQVAQQWRKCKHLVIDEISMVDGEFFEKLEAVAR